MKFERGTRMFYIFTHPLGRLSNSSATSELRPVFSAITSDHSICGSDIKAVT